MHRGYVKNWRKIDDDPIVSRPFACHLFAHLIRRASWTEKEVSTRSGDKKLKSGQCYLGLRETAKHLGISLQNIRSALKYLESTHKVTLSATPHGTTVTVCKYELYQSLEEPPNTEGNTQGNTEVTQTQHRGNTEVTPTKNLEAFKAFKEETIKSKPKRSSRFTPPTQEEVQARITEKGYSIDAEAFIAHYEGNGWMTGRNHVKSWKACLTTWSKNDFDRQKPKQPELVNYNPKAVFRAGNR